jgi:hypothetical protein
MPSDAPYPDDDTVDDNLTNLLLRGDDTAPNEAGLFPGNV